MKSVFRLFVVAMLVSGGVWLGGCTSLFSGSLRVEVDVYKGPLTKGVDAQKAEFVGLVKGIPDLLQGLDTQFARSQCRIGCLERTDNQTCGTTIEGEAISTHCLNPTAAQCQALRTPQACTKQQKETDGSKCQEKSDIDRYHDTHDGEFRQCHELSGLRSRLHSLQQAVTEHLDDTKLKTFATSADASVEAPVYGSVLALAAQFRAAATEVSFQWAGAIRESTTVRIDQVKYANAMAEMSNHLASRADSLMKQRLKKIDKEQFSTGGYLRDSAVTGYTNTYKWLDAHAGKKEISVEERTEIVDQLFDDGTWARVNEVYASGTGKVSMAFIKDDIGNWDLKAFENDPTEMIESFRAVGQASLKAATDLAKSGGAGMVADKLTNAKAAYFGGGAATATVLPPGLTFDDQRNRIVKELESIKASYGGGSSDLEARDAALRSASRVVEKHAYLIEALQQAVIFQADSQNNQDKPENNGKK